MGATQGLLPAKHCKQILAEFKKIKTANLLDEIKPVKGKTIKALTKERDDTLAVMMKMDCFNCPSLAKHMIQMAKLTEYKEELKKCETLLEAEGNDKERDF